jgi:hypothetical protein
MAPRRSIKGAPQDRFAPFHRLRPENMLLEQAVSESVPKPQNWGDFVEHFVENNPSFD